MFTDGYKPRTFEQLIIQVQNVLYVRANRFGRPGKKEVQNVLLVPIVQNLCFVCVCLREEEHLVLQICAPVLEY